MKHHEYQIYYGGFKNKISCAVYCNECNAIICDDYLTKLKRKHVIP